MKCPKCQQPMPSAAPACSSCGYEFPSPENLDLVTAPNLILLEATLISLCAAGFSAFVAVTMLFQSNWSARSGT